MGLAFGNPLELCLCLASEAELGCEDCLTEIWYNVKHKRVDEFVKSELHLLVEEAIF